MLTYLLFIVGFVILIKGADFLVDGASAIARRLKVSDLVIGLTVVAFGTSTPELFVNIVASIRGNADIANGNVLGSNIANVFLVLGVSSIICLREKKACGKDFTPALPACCAIEMIHTYSLIHDDLPGMDDDDQRTPC